MIPRTLAALALITSPLVAQTPPSAASDPALQRLEDSPRHHEWVQVRQGERIVHAYVVYPEIASKATAVILIHENRGLTDWVRAVADRLAETGYLAIAPDLLSGAAPGGGRTADFPSSDAAREGISKLDADQVTRDLAAVADYVTALPAANGKVAVAGFCWGGGQSFRFATNRPNLAAAFVFYGNAPDEPVALARISAPVHGFYGGNDARIGAGIPATVEKMKAAGKVYEPVTYDGAGHGFLRAGEAVDASPADRAAQAAAWQRWLQLLGKL